MELDSLEELLKNISKILLLKKFLEEKLKNNSSVSVTATKDKLTFKLSSKKTNNKS